MAKEYRHKSANALPEEQWSRWAAVHQVGFMGAKETLYQFREATLEKPVVNERQQMRWRFDGQADWSDWRARYVTNSEGEVVDTLNYVEDLTYEFREVSAYKAGDVINTPAELKRCKIETILRDAQGDAWKLVWINQWDCTDSEISSPYQAESMEAYGPFTVLYVNP